MLRRMIHTHAARQRAVIAAAGLSLCVLGGITVAVVPSTALAQAAALTAEQATTIQQQIQAAIASVNAQQFPDDAAKQAALATAIANATVAAIPPGVDPAAVTAVVIVVASDAGVSEQTIGMALGQAAVQIARRGCNTVDMLPDSVRGPDCTTAFADAMAIAQSVANEGTGSMAAAFAAAVGAAGGPVQVALAATGTPQAVGEIPRGLDDDPAGFVVPLACENPSCV
jgi:hypothetical protein